MKLLIIRLLIVLIALSMTACHTLFTAPALFAHGSSRAFDMAITMYFLIIVPFGWLLLASRVLFTKGKK